jgi:tetraacyldisaccharide 4'-kinase
MRLEPPGWWYGHEASDKLKTLLLQPAGLLYGTMSRARFALTKPYRSTLPVVCAGNFTMGGAGKTPLALALAHMVRDLGHRPTFLTRGYGGRLPGPYKVDPARDSAFDVGDEALLLARQAPTILSRDRTAGARAIEALDASIIIMDDGFQNPSLVKDLSFIAIDAAAGIGNARVFPAGPLRAPLSFQIEKASAAVVIGRCHKPAAFLNGKIPIIEAHLTPTGDLDWLKAQPVIAFSGIGRPGKFFETLHETGADIVSERAFPDHHNFTEAEARELIDSAKRLAALLVTTEKDWVRIFEAPGPLAELKRLARAVPVALAFSENNKQAILEILSSLRHSHIATES